MDTVLLLLSAGASVNAQDLDGWTPLMYTARNEIDGEGLARVLIAAGADVNKTNNRGRTGERVVGGLEWKMMFPSSLPDKVWSVARNGCAARIVPCKCMWHYSTC